MFHPIFTNDGIDIFSSTSLSDITFTKIKFGKGTHLGQNPLYDPDTGDFNYTDVADSLGVQVNVTKKSIDGNVCIEAVLPFVIWANAWAAGDGKKNKHAITEWGVFAKDSSNVEKMVLYYAQYRADENGAIVQYNNPIQINEAYDDPVISSLTYRQWLHESGERS